MPGVEAITLWHYCSLAGEKLDYTIETLKDNTVFLASPESFNDLEDCRFKIDPAASERAKLATIARLFEQGEGLTHEKALTKAEQVLTDQAWLDDMEARTACHGLANLFRESFGIYCMSESRDDPLLWGHYADSHAGLCIGFFVKASCAHRAAFIAGVPGWPVLQVQYDDADALPTVKLYNENPLAILPLVTTKSKKWCNEREWRLVLPDHANQKIRLPSGSITDVILGATISPENRKATTEAVQEHQPQARLLEARQRDGLRGLDIVPISPVS